MFFLVTVRWHPDGKGEVETYQVNVRAVRGDDHTLVLDGSGGLEVRFPLAYIEWVQMERKG